MLDKFTYIYNNINSVYIHGRPSGHPIHDDYARILKADFCFTDHKIRWHDVENVSKLRRFFSWIVCAITFPNKKKYDVFFTEGVRESVLFLKLFRLITKKQKIIALIASESLYFLDNKKYNYFSSLIIKQFFKNCDAVICIGEEQKKLAIKYSKTKFIYSIYNGLSISMINKLDAISPNLSSKIILVIANADSEWRVFYKGIDICIDSFNIVAKNNKTIELHILGNYDENIMKPFLENSKIEIRNRIFFKGNVNVTEYFNNTCLTLQLGRGDSFPTSSLESAFAGVPVFISEETGTKEFLNNELSRFCVSLNPKEVAVKIENYLAESIENKKFLSKCFKKAVSFYTQESANLNFELIFNKILTDLEINNKKRV